MLSGVSSAGSDVLSPPETGAGRREHVLDAALLVFARYGYRKASMDDVARAAVTHALDGDIAAAERSLADTDRPLRDRLIEAFDHWTARYIGSLAKDVTTVIESNPDLLGPLVAEYPARFARLVTDAVTRATPAGRTGVASDVAQTLLSTAIGIKHQVDTREEFLTRMTTAVGLLLPALEHRS